MQETGGVPQDDKTFQLEYNWNETGWLDITAASSVIAASDSTFLTDGDDTTRQLGAGSFISVNGGIDEADGSAGGSVLDFSGSDQVELEFCLQIAGSDVYEGDTIQLRVKGLDGYTVVPELSVTGALVPETDGGVAVYREETASENYTSTSPVAVEWDTNVLVDTATFSRTGTAILLKERGHYLATWSMVGDESGDDRAKLEGLLELEGQQLAYGRGWGYLRDSADATESYAQGATIINAGLNDELILKVFRQETNTGAQGWVRRSSSSGIALIKLNEGWDYARYREAVGGQNIYFPEASKVTIDLDTTDEQDAPFSRGSGAVTIADSGIYMVTFNLGLNHNGTGGRKNGVAALYLNSSEVPGTRVTGYVRDSNGDLEGGLSYIGLITVSANDILTIQAWCDLGDATGELTIDGSTTAVTLARLPEAADFLQLHEAGGGQDLALTSTNITFDTNDRVDSASFSRSGAEDEIIVNHTDEYLVTWSVFAQTPDTSTVREEILTQLSVNGAVVPYGTAGNFIRAAQGGVNCLAGGASMGTVLSLQQNDIIRLVQQNEGGDSTAVFE
ncbi:MAG: hypothetical protein GY868_15345, partial [Deltaproteobacteria bacterium]|nr:hypothetical protein [Deltaproteobacteria bacterium]